MQYHKLLATLNQQQLRQLYNLQNTDILSLKSTPKEVLKKIVAGIQEVEEHGLPILMEMEHNALISGVLQNKDITPYEAFVLGVNVFKMAKQEMLNQISLQK